MKFSIFLFFFFIKSNVFALDTGLHIFEVQFGNGPKFKDIVTVENNNKGSFTVPSVFSFPIEIETKGTQFSFLVKGKEGERPFSFVFQGTSNIEQSSGKIFDQDSGAQIGRFNGVKVYDL